MGKRAKQPDQRRMPVAQMEGPIRSLRRWWFALAGLLIGGVAFTVWAVGLDAPQPLRYQVVAAYPHDPTAYCQGLVYDRGVLYEGTGKYGASSLRRVDLESGRVLQLVPLDRRFFGEGVTVWKDWIIQLTWEDELGIVYDRRTLREVLRFSYEGEGWGLTHDGTHLIMSDGTWNLRYLDPNSFRVVRYLTVRDGPHRVKNLNELEYVNGEILANVWYQDYILRISPRSGEVVGKIELGSLWPKEQRPDRDHVLNGIAYDAAADRLLVTGKNWPKLYALRITRGGAGRR